MIYRIDKPFREYEIRGKCSSSKLLESYEKNHHYWQIGHEKHDFCKFY